MKKSTSTLSFLAALIACGQADITTFAEYHLGEDGLALPPLDSSINARDFTSVARPANLAVGTDGVTATASTAYSISGNGGWFGGPFADLPTDDFAVGIYARAANFPGVQTHVLTLGRGANTVRISLGLNGWEANLEQVGLDEFGNPLPQILIGSEGAFVADTWVHLAVIRQGGSMSIYIDGIAQGGADDVNEPVHKNLGHLVINPGGAASFAGDVDEMRVVTFAPEDEVADIVTALQGIDRDDDGLFDDFEQRIIDANANDGINSLNDVLPGDNFDGDELTNLEEQNGVTDPTDENDPPEPPSGELELLAFWDFNDSSVAGEAADSRSGFVGSLQGGAAYTSGGGGRTGEAGDFGVDFGVDDAGQTMLVNALEFTEAVNASLLDDRLVISFWQKNAATGNSSSFYFNASGVRVMQSHLPWSNGQIYFDHETATGRNRVNTLAPEGTDFSQWHHYLFVKDGLTKQTYIDGVLFQDVSGLGIVSNVTSLNIGSGVNGTPSLQGVIDDFAIFNQALEPEQIAALAAGASPEEFFAGPQDVEITKLALNGSEVTLTWKSEETASYSAFYSFDLLDWSGDLNDSINADPGTTTTRMFDLSAYGLEGERQVFFRVERQ